jgi:hypothetical protein
MTVRFERDVIFLSGDCRVEDAEPLASLLSAQPVRRIDISQAAALHTAVVQILIAFEPELLGTPSDPFLRQWILPILRQAW